MMAAIGAVLAGGWARVAAFGAAVAGVVLAVGGAFATVRRDGARGQALRDAQAREAERAAADKAQADVARLDDADVLRELRSKFTRKP